MPTYVYRCARCGTEFEVFQAISEPPVTVCPAGHAEVERLISGGAGLLFRGSGFYITDHRSTHYRARAAAESGAAGAGPEAGGKETSS
jgi:putative FmdB family regulatory protein